MREMKIRDRNYPNWRLEITDNGVVRWNGVERGPLTLHYENAQYLVLKEAGHQWYYNQYNGQKYEPAKFIVFKKWAVDIPYKGEPSVQFELQQTLEFYVKPDLSYLKT
jgi:hypothetical protein